MAQEDVRLSGTFLDSAGNALAGKTVTLFAEGTITPALATDTTDSGATTAGEWDFTRTTPGRYDVQLVNGTQTYRVLSRDKFQVTELTARNPTTALPALSAYSTTSEASSLVATFGFRPSTESSGVETADAPSDNDNGYINYTLSNDHTDRQQWVAGRLSWVGLDVSDGSEDGQIKFEAMAAGSLATVLTMDSTGVTGSIIKDEDNMASDSATHLASQQSIKAYVDAQQDTVDTWGEVLALGNASGGTGVVITAGDAFTVNTITETTAASGVTIDSVLLKDNTVKAGTLTIGAGSITDSSGTISFDDENLTTTGVVTAAGFTIGSGVITEAELEILDGASVSTAELNILTGATVVVGEVNYLDLGATAVGTAVASKAVVLDSDKDYTGIRNLTATTFVGALTGNVTGNASGTAATVTTASQGNITTLAALTSFGAAGATTNVVAGDVTRYNAVNDGNPTISVGSSSAERLLITASYVSGGQLLDYVKFATVEASSTANRGKYIFDVDGTDILTIDDSGLNVGTGSLETATIDYTDGDLAITIADGGGTTFAQTMTVTGLLSTTAGITSGEDIAVAATKKLEFDGASGHTYIYEESDDDLHVVVGNVAYIQIDQDIDAMSFGSSSAPNIQAQTMFDGSWMAGEYGGFGVGIETDITGAAGATALAHMGIRPLGQGSVTTQNGSITYTDISTLKLAKPGISKFASDSITTAATLYIADAPSGVATTHAAIYVASGDVIIGAANGQLKATHNLALYADFGNAQGGSEIRFNLDNSQVGFVGAGGLMMLGDTANDNMTVGLTINQGANTNEIFALKSTYGSFNHGGFLSESDTFYAIRKHNTDLGGVRVHAIAEDGALSTVINWEVAGGTPDTTKSSSGRAIVEFRVREHDGSGNSANLTTNGNTFGVNGRVGGADRLLFLVDEDGDLFADGGTTTDAVTVYDNEDDISLVRAFDMARGGEGLKGIIVDQWDKYATENENTLVRHGILGDTIDNGGLVNVTRLQQLHNGAIWQLNTKHMSLADKVDGLEVELIEAKKQLAAISA